MEEALLEALKSTKTKPESPLQAAAALEYDLVSVTRSTRDFGELGLQLLNPWQAPS